MVLKLELFQFRARVTSAAARVAESAINSASGFGTDRIPGALVSVRPCAAVIVRVTLDTTEGRLVACAVIITVPPLGTAGGGLYAVTTPVRG